MNIISENKYSYNGHDLKKVTNALNYFVTNTYDTQHRLTDTLDPLTHTTHFTYDSEHHLTQTQDALGNTVSATYYPNGLSYTATDARSVTTTLTYDAYGNPQTTQTAGHPAVTYAYDAIGRMTGLTDQAGSSTGFVYDKRNLILSKTDPLGGVTTYGYNNAGRLTGKTDRNNNAVTYAYTPSDKLERITYPNSSYVQFNYNQLDNLISMQDASGTTGFAYDAAGSLTSLTDPRNFAVSYQYDAAGNVTRITYPGNKAVTYTYDALNRLKTVTNWLSQTATYNYDAAGRLADYTNFNSTVTTYGYDDANRLYSLENKTSGSSVIANYQFTLDGNGNRTGVVQNEPLTPTLATGEISYTYNIKKNRLLTAAANTFAYDNEGRISTGYGVNYTFDYEHRLTGIGATDQFVYDGRGNRLQATRNGTTTRYIYDAAGNLIAEADGNNNITRYYIYGQGLLAMATPADQVYCYHFNATGSTIAVTDASQTVVNKYAYDPFGNVADQVEAVSQPFKFVGQFGVMTEANGFYYMRARYYDPQVGRFLSEDPIGFDGGDVNLFAYVQNNPVNGIDPSGLAPGDWWHPILHPVEFYDRARELRTWGHQNFSGEANSDVRHSTVSYLLTKEYGPGWTRAAGVANEVQGLVMHDIPNLVDRIKGNSPWAFRWQDLQANEAGIQRATRENASQTKCNR